METLKIEIGVTVKLSDATMGFLSELFLPKDSITPKMKEQEPEQEQEQEPEQEPVEIDYANLRKLTVEKIRDHRDEIKAKLKDLGVDKISSLPEESYADMYHFLSKL